MVDDPNRKSPRTFQCRDYLWESFDEMSAELECSVDYLVNEAMRHYLRAQGRAPRGSGEARPAAPTPPSASANGARPAAPPPVPSRAAMPAMPGPAARGSGPPPVPGRPSSANIPALPPMPSAGARPGGSGAIPSLPARPGPPVAIPKLGGGAQAAARGGARTLYASYGGEDFPVNKEEFFIGRGQKTCDLVIRDTNISRQHARVVLHNGAYWIIDNQSTNGVEFRGAKIQQKKVEDGDAYTICGHEITFAYR